MLLRTLDRSPNLQDLGVSFPTDHGVNAGRVPQDLEQAFQSMKTLRNLSILDFHIGRSCFAELSTLPHLVSLYAEIADDTDDLPVKTHESGSSTASEFHSLERLMLYLEREVGPSEVLSTFRYPRLKVFTLIALAWSPTNPDESIMRTFRQLSTSCSPSNLESIQLVIGDCPFSPGETSGCDHAISAASLRCLCIFHNLREVRVQAGLPIILDDDTMRDMATSWPHLEYLDIRTESDDDPLVPTALTLHGLAHLARYCPSLSKLSIHLNTSIPFEPSSATTPEHRNYVLEQADFFGISRVQHNHADIATYLFTLFPNLKKIKQRYIDRDGIGKSWRQVEEIIHASRGSSLSVSSVSIGLVTHWYDCLTEEHPLAPGSVASTRSA